MIAALLADVRLDLRTRADVRSQKETTPAALVTLEGPIEPHALGGRDSMTEDYPKHTTTRKHLRASSPSRVTDNVHCIDCARARRDGRPWGCRVHVAEEVLP